jgi:hypothetical protein
MTAIAIAMLALGFMLAGVLVGIFIRRALPEDHLSSDSKDVLKLSMGVVATLAALVLGLRIATAKNSFDARETEINQITAYAIQLDRMLALYGQEAQAARVNLRQTLGPMVDRIWSRGLPNRRGPHLSKRPPRARSFIKASTSSNRRTTRSAACMPGSFSSPRISPKHDYCCLHKSVVRCPLPFWRS